MGGWGTDYDLTQSATDPNVWSGTVALQATKAFKFRADHAWTTAWGAGIDSNTGLMVGYLASGGYSGWATSNNGPNIVAPVTANYFVYINTATGQFFYGNVDSNGSANAPYNQISLIGDVTSPNHNWSDDFLLVQNPANPFEWSGKTSLTTGNAATPDGIGKFRANLGWNTALGGSNFPNGVGTTSGGNISIKAGSPQMTFNSATGEYTFTY